MIFLNVSLSGTQLKMLDYVSDSYSDGIYHNWTHHSWAGVLLNLELMTVGRYATKWRVVLTNACVCCLLHEVNLWIGEAKLIKINQTINKLYLDTWNFQNRR